MNRIIQAANFAAQKHAGQTRKYFREPYIYHPARVAARVTLIPDADEDLICAAWLHDTLEDTDTRPMEIDRAFGTAVTNLVLGLTNPPKHERLHLPRHVRKAEDCARLATSSHRVKLIKLADRIDNLRSLLTGAPREFAVMYLDESNDLINALILSRHPSMDELIREAIGTHTAVETMIRQVWK